MKSESSDTYFYIIDGKPTQAEFQAAAERELGDELGYISEYDIVATYEHSLHIDFPDEAEGDDEEEEGEGISHEELDELDRLMRESS